MAATTGRKSVGGAAKLRCPDCGFKAAHAMGLGRHRSARHGVVSKRQQTRRATGGWLTRHEAARRAGVHYNTIRQWEHAGLVRRTKRPGIRGALISASDLARLAAERASVRGDTPIGADPAALAAIERRYRELIAGLEQLLASVRASAPASKDTKKPARKPAKSRAKARPARPARRTRR